MASNVLDRCLAFIFSIFRHLRFIGRLLWSIFAIFTAQRTIRREPISPIPGPSQYLPHSRLTLPSAELLGRDQIAGQVPSKPHSQSLLFTLPLELRRQVYHYALGGRIVHITRLASHIGHIKCFEPNVPEYSSHRCWGIMEYNDIYSGPHEETEMDRQRFLPLLTTCQKIYSEALDIVYSDNIFNTRHLEATISLSLTIPPQRLRSICTLNMSWPLASPYPFYTEANIAHNYPPHDEKTWERAWAVLARMTGLKKLDVCLKAYWAVPLTVEAERRMLKPAWNVESPRTWNLCVSWPDTGLDINDAPFRIERNFYDRPPRFDASNLVNRTYGD